MTTSTLEAGQSIVMPLVAHTLQAPRKRFKMLLICCVSSEIIYVFIAQFRRILHNSGYFLFDQVDSASAWSISLQTNSISAWSNTSSFWPILYVITIHTS